MPPAIAHSQGATLRDYGGRGAPILFVPSLINPPTVLDLHGNSMLRWFAAQQFHISLLDWGTDVPPRREWDIGAHIENILLPLIAALPRPPMLVGYCLGGTMAIAAAAHAKLAAVATIAAPWRFDAYAAPDRAMLTSLWRAAEPAATALGVLPMEILQTAFWSIDPDRTVAKYERLATLDPVGAEARAFVALEDWANDGPPLATAAARELFEGLIGANRSGAGDWRVGRKSIDPATLACPLLTIASTVDRIVPHATAVPGGERIDLDLGHVGMIVGSRARAALWEPLARWLSSRTANC